jgi:hypothetical protein
LVEADVDEAIASCGGDVRAASARRTTIRPTDRSDTPPQEHDAKCGFERHTIVKNRDYVFAEYATR